MRKTIKFRPITSADFETFFALDSPGYYLAKEALKAREVATALQTLEVLVLVNKLAESEFENTVARALLPYGKTLEYLQTVGTHEGQQLVIQTLGEKRVEQILYEVAASVKEQTKIGTGENDQATP